MFFLVDLRNGKTFSSLTGKTSGLPSVKNYLNFKTKFDISAQGYEVAGLAVDSSAGDNGIIYVVSYCDGTKIWKYNLTDGSYLGYISLSQPIPVIQGIAVKDGYFYISSDARNVQKVSLSGEVLGTILRYAAVGSFEGIDYSQDKLLTLIDQGTGDKKIYFWEPRGESILDITSANKIASALNFTGGRGALSIDYQLPSEGTISLWFYPKSPYYDYNTVFDNSVGSDYWEMWVYQDGRLAARTGDDTKVEYDLDNINGPDTWYYITFSWRKTGEKTLYVNGMPRSSNAIVWKDPGTTFYIGGGNAANTRGNGYYDEIRISDNIHSANWISTEYNNQNSPLSFCMAGVQTDVFGANNPSIQPNTSQSFVSLSSFSESATKNGGEIKYQISNDGGTTWYWYNSGWTATAAGYNEANTASDINSHILTFPTGEGRFLFRAFLHSDGTQMVQLNGVSITEKPSAAFIPPQKPQTNNITVSNTNGTLTLDNLPSSITQIAVSLDKDFKNISWEDISKKEELLKQYANEKEIYIKLRTQDGAVSDIITYNIQTSTQDTNAGDTSNTDNTTAISDGDTVKTPQSSDIYVIKKVNNKNYKRLILSPNVFNSYQHLKWENVKTISEEELNNYTTSNLVQEITDTVVYALTYQEDQGQRKPFDINQTYDPDSIYTINKTERDSYEWEE